MPYAGRRTRVLLMSPQGRRFDQKLAEAYSRERHLILVAGHYEGVDQRVADHLVDDEDFHRRLRANQWSPGCSRRHRRHRASDPRACSAIRIAPLRTRSLAAFLTIPTTPVPKIFADGRCRMFCSRAIILLSKAGEDSAPLEITTKDGPTCYE